MSWIERHLQERADEGFFDDLPGSGRPIADIETAYSPTWWATRWLERDAALQDSKDLRQRLSKDVAAAIALPFPESRHRLEQIAAALVEVNRHLDTVHQLPTCDVDSVLIRGEWTT